MKVSVFRTRRNWQCLLRSTLIVIRIRQNSCNPRAASSRELKTNQFISRLHGFSGSNGRAREELSSASHLRSRAISTGQERKLARRNSFVGAKVMIGLILSMKNPPTLQKNLAERTVVDPHGRSVKNILSFQGTQK